MNVNRDAKRSATLLEGVCQTGPALHDLEPMIARRVTPASQLGLDLNLSTKKTRKREFLDEMDRVTPWSALVQIAEPHSPRAKTGRPPVTIETMLRIHCGNVSDINVAGALLHGEERAAFGDSGPIRARTNERRLRSRLGTWRCARANAGYLIRSSKWTFADPS